LNGIWVIAADRGRLLCQIDSHRAPGNAPPAADTSAGAELLPPGSQFMPHPVTVATANGMPVGAGCGAGKLVGETGFPTARARGFPGGEIA